MAKPWAWAGVVGDPPAIERNNATAGPQPDHFRRPRGSSSTKQLEAGRSGAGQWATASSPANWRALRERHRPGDPFPGHPGLGRCGAGSDRTRVVAGSLPCRSGQPAAGVRRAMSTIQTMDSIITTTPITTTATCRCNRWRSGWKAVSIARGLGRSCAIRSSARPFFAAKARATAWQVPSPQIQAVGPR